MSGGIDQFLAGAKRQCRELDRTADRSRRRQQGGVHLGSPVFGNRTPDPGSDASSPADRRFLAPYMKDLLASKGEDGPPWLLPNVLVERGLHLISSAPGAGKTFLALDLALHLCRGEPWLGHQPKGPMSVGYVDEEMGQRLMRDRLVRLGFTDDDNRFYYFDRPGMRLDNPEDVRALWFAAGLYHLRVIFFDSLVACHDYAESSNDDMRRLRDDLRPLRDAGIACVFLHHNRKGSASGGSPTQDDARGAADIMAMMDLAYTLQKNAPDMMRLKSCKNRLMPDASGLDVQLRIEDTEGEAGPRTHVREVDAKAMEAGRHAGLRAKVLSVLEQNGGPMRQPELLDRCGKRRETVLKTLHGLEADRRIARETLPGKGTPQAWSIVLEDQGYAIARA